MNFVKKIAEFTYFHRLLFSVAAAVLCAAAVIVAKHAPFKTDVYDLIPFWDSQLENARMTADWFGVSNSVYFNVSGGSGGAARACALKLRDELEKEGFKFDSFPDPSRAAAEIPKVYPQICNISELERSISPDSIKKRFSYYMRRMSGFEAPVFKSAFVSDPAGTIPLVLEKLKKLSGGGAEYKFDGSLISDAGGKNFLLIARSDANGRDSTASAKVCESIDRACSRTLESGVKIDWTGSYRISADNAKIARSDSYACMAATCVLMLALCFVAFRNKLFAPLAVMPSLLGSAAAFCFAGAVFGKISTISVAFASIALGVGIDYAVHVLCPLDLKGRFDIRFAAGVAGKLAAPILVICSTTLMAFVIVGCLGGGMVQLGAFGFVGVFASAVFSLCALPAFAVSAGGGSGRAALLERVSKRILRPQFSSPRAFLILVFAISAVAAPLALNVRFDGKISSMNALLPESEAADSNIRRLWGNMISSPQIVAYGDNLESALASLKSAESAALSYPKASPAMLSGLLVPRSDSCRNIGAWEEFWTAERLKSFSDSLSAECAKNGVSFKIFKPALDFIASARAQSVGIEDSGELSKIFSKRIFKGGGVAAVCAPVYLNDGASKAELARIVEAADGNAFILDMEYLGEHISNKTRGIFLKCALCALAVVGIFLAVSLRSAAMAACAMACVCAGLVWCFALMRLCGVPITLTNFIFVIFSVCLAQDYAVMIMWAAVREKKGVSAAGPVLLSALTTTAAFGALAFARHPVISGLGAAAGISIFSILCASVLAAPAFAKILGGEFDDK